MVERLTALDASFFYLEERNTPLHVGGVLVLEAPPGGLDAVEDLVRARLPLVPRYRQRVLEVPGHLASPVWADDPGFDFGYHVRRSALPRPGSQALLLDLVSRVMSRPLDRRRPLWELYLVEGLAGGRVAMITKTHPGLVDGLSAIDIGQVLLDVDPRSPHPEPEEWTPRRPPGSTELVVQALEEYVRRPSAALEAARRAVTDAGSEATRLAGVGRDLLKAARTAVFPAPSSPLNATTGRQRRISLARVDLEDVKEVRRSHGGTVNDVLLTVVTGALREWLLSRGERVDGSSSVRALVPVALQDAEASPGGRVAAMLVDLPVGEPNPGVRLARLGYAMRGVGQQSGSVAADRLIALTGFAPPTMHALGVRAARGLSRRLFNLVVTNVPGPQVPLYAAGGRVLEVFPVVPLARGQGLSIGMTSYDGCVFIGLNADRDGVGDGDVLADLIEQEVAELVRTAA
jgi:diacylglycerol O-acyltransferase